MIVRAAPNLESAERLAGLHALCFPRSWTVEAIAVLMAQPGVVALEVGEDGRAAAFVLIRSAGDDAEILTLAVDPARRRRGLARALVDAAVAALPAGVGALWLEVAADNAAALALYRGTGFEAAGLRTGYYRSANGPPVDAVVMRRTLNTGAG